MLTAVTGVRFSPVLVCLSGYLHYISESDAAVITRLDIQTFLETHLF